MSASKQALQEWDAAYYDDANNHLYLAEAKHHMNLNHIKKVTHHISKLSDLFAKTVTNEYINMRPASIKVVLASGSTLQAAELREAQSHGYLLCKTSGGRYYVEPALSSSSPVQETTASFL